MLQVKRNIAWQRIIKLAVLALGCIVTGAVYAQGGKDLGSLAENMMESFKSLGSLMIAVSYLAGIGFAIAAIFKFKQHKDNPTQITLGTPIAMLAIGIMLVFLPLLFGPAGETVFGTDAQTGAGGFKGKGVESIPGAKEGGGP